ncbi:hypothetical protein C6P40_000304 [Pichia californica]|uniref:RNA polymerase II-associated protein 3 n=1 Tax=Pichia californica TaxID=460514 RepID=A0A9P7BFI1_9ASCO|nr:hypothetical protein C6P42_000389 [[Candida] californica]KAG0688966.1 hypothetical protein C6P40_000304 [[Candida] californica]
MIKQSENLREEGNTLFRKGSFEAALNKYLAAAQLSQDNSVICSNLAATYLKLQKWDDAIRYCDRGISIIYPERNTQKALYVKLLWRKAHALKSKGLIHDARITIEKALDIDPTNRTLLLDKQKFESEDVFFEENAAEIISIPIQEVDEIPNSFFTLTTDSKLDSIPPSDSNTTKVFPNIPADETNYPIHPSVQFLSTLGAKPNSMSLSYYKYVMLVDPNEYRNIYSRSGVDLAFLDFFLDACIYFIENNQLEYESNITELLSLFRSLPRFSLTSTFADSKKVKLLSQLFTFKLQKSFNSFWV